MQQLLRIQFETFCYCPGWKLRRVSPRPVRFLSTSLAQVPSEIPLAESVTKRKMAKMIRASQDSLEDLLHVDIGALELRRVGTIGSASASPEIPVTYSEQERMF